MKNSNLNVKVVFIAHLFSGGNCKPCTVAHLFQGSLLKMTCVPALDYLTDMFLESSSFMSWHLNLGLSQVKLNIVEADVVKVE